MEIAIIVIPGSLLTSSLMFFAVKLSRAFHRHRLLSVPHPAASPEGLPTVSICIPARNETHAMTQSLERVLASDYEKLEVIVFDDSSEDNTSHLIRSFAHAGVRFVPGSPLPSGWLGKSHALDTLAQEASGSYLVFMDVDTFIDPHTISRLIRHMMSHKLEMLSVIPSRDDASRLSALFGTLRYFWELIADGRRRAAASSSLWIIKRDVLQDRIGGLVRYKSDVRPEVTIATYLGSAYSYLVNSKVTGVSFEKKWQSQTETARRLLYPMAGARWYRALPVLFGLLLLNAPLFVVAASVVVGWSMVSVMALWFMFAFMALYGVYASYMWRARWWLGGFLWPVVIFQELVLFVSSWWGYARGTITWKGRRITETPVATDHLVIDE